MSTDILDKVKENAVNSSKRKYIVWKLKQILLQGFKYLTLKIKLNNENLFKSLNFQPVILPYHNCHCNQVFVKNQRIFFFLKTTFNKTSGNK